MQFESAGVWEKRELSQWGRDGRGSLRLAGCGRLQAAASDGGCFGRRLRLVEPVNPVSPTGAEQTFDASLQIHHNTKSKKKIPQGSSLGIWGSIIIRICLRID